MDVDGVTLLGVAGAVLMLAMLAVIVLSSLRTFSVSKSGSLSFLAVKGDLKLGPRDECTEPMSWKSGVCEIADMDAIEDTGIPF